MTEFKKIIVNGKEYNGLEEVPDALRAVLADQNHNGIPDVMEQIFQNPMVQKVLARTGGAQVFNNLDQLPPETREKVLKVFQRLGMPVPGGSPGSTDVQIQTIQTNLDATTPAQGAVNWGTSANSANPASNAAIDWSKIAAPSEPKSISPKALAFLLAMIFCMLIGGWLAFMFFLKK